MKTLVTSIICLLAFASSVLYAQSTAIIIGGENSELSADGIVSGDGCLRFGGTGAALLDTFNVYYQPNGEGDFVDNLFPDPERYSFEMNIPEGLPDHQSMGKHGSFWDSHGRNGEGELPWINENWREGRYFDHQYRPTGDEPWFGVLDTMPQWTINYWDVFEQDSLRQFFIHTIFAGTVKDFVYDEETGNATALLELFEICYKGYTDNGEPGPGLIEFEGGSYQGFDSFREASGRFDFPAFFFEWNNEEHTGSLTPCGTRVKHIGEGGWIMGYYDAIQDAIDAAEDGDTVLVSPGVYFENLDFNGRDIVLASLFLTTGDDSFIDSTIIDGGSRSRVITIEDVEGGNCLLTGFTLQNGGGHYDGGGIYLGNADISLQNLIIKENYAEMNGGGIYVEECDDLEIYDVFISDNVSGLSGGGLTLYSTEDVILQNVIIDGNSTETQGGGLFNYGSHTAIMDSKIINNHSNISGGGIAYDLETDLQNVLIAGNSAGEEGGAIRGHGGIIHLRNCTIVDNYAPTGSTFASHGARYLLTNSIIWGIGENPVSSSVYEASVEYCDVQNGEDFFRGVEINNYSWGDGNIDEDPRFVDPDNGDYHLTADSPCIDTGDPDSPEDPDGTRADMGCYYFHQFDSPVEVPDDFETIQAAINAVMDGDTILVHPGSYLENIDFSGKDIILGSLYLTTGDTSYIESTTIDGYLAGIVVNFENGETEAAHLTGFSIINGSSESNGGGIRCANASPTILYCHIENNSAQTRGGGISCEPDAHPTISNCIITDNSAGSGGGGIWCGESSHPSITGCYIAENEAHWNGGGINLYNGCEPLIEGCVIVSNTAGSKGGGIIVSQDCNPVIKNCYISGNYSVENGGGIAVERAANPVIDHCLLLGNMCEQMTGWELSAESGSKVEFSNNTITWMAIEGWTFAIQCTASDLIIMNSIIWGDSPLTITVDSDSTGSGRLIVTNSDIYGLGGSVNLDEDAELIWLDGNIHADPVLVSLHDGDYNLTSESPCIDAGTSFFVWEEDTLINMSADEYHDDAPDMGALESQFSDVSANKPNTPTEFALYPCFPNPFNSTTTISYSLPVASQVSLKVFDLSGREVKSLVDGYVEAGSHSVSLSGEGMASGVYLVRMEAGEGEQVRKVLLVR